MYTYIRNSLAAIGLWMGAVCHAQHDSLVHPAFIKLPAHFTEAWKAGERDAERKREVNTFLKMFTRGIGNISTGLSSRTVSIAWYVPPEYAAYYYAHQGRRLYKSEQEIEALRSQNIPSTPIIVDKIRFDGIITLWPSFGLYGFITRFPDPNDLSDVRVVLKVGDRILQPVKQPGNLLQRKGQQIVTAIIPRSQTTTWASSAYYTGTQTTYYSGSYLGQTFSGIGTSSGSGYLYSTTTSTSYYLEHIEQGFTWYQGVFSVEFKIFDEQGNPLITEKDKEVTLIVIYGRNERHAKFKLSEIANPTSSKSIRQSEQELRCIAQLNLAFRLITAKNASKAREILNQVEKTAQKYESTKHTFALINYMSLLASDEKEAYLYAEKLLNTEQKDNPYLLASIAWVSLTNTSPVSEPNYRLILRVASRACEATEYKDPLIISILSLALYKNGEISEALRRQEEAIQLAKRQGLPKELIEQLEKSYNEMKK